MPRISVVVPMYNVEEYLAACLDSILAQQVDDLEVVMVDDGSKDGTAAIAAAYAERDPRFRLIQQPNAGLSAARNTGIEVVTGEFLSFVDSDDMLTPAAYSLLLGALEKTGSDFATGNVQRFTRWGSQQSRFVANAFKRTRLETHVTRFRPLLADRTAWNKLFRREFWEKHHFRFPEGRVHEDIPVILPAHVKAKSVDVISDPVYLYRMREGGALSITERRAEQKVLRDRLTAVKEVREFLKAEGQEQAARWYDESIVGDDLRYYINVLDVADDEYRAYFMDEVNALLDDFDEGVYDGLLAIDRLKYHLVRRRLVPELIVVRRFEREDIKATPPVREGRRWYGDYPYRGDARLAIPDSVYQLSRELGLNAQIEEMRVQDGKLHIGGYAFIDGIGAPEKGVQKLSMAAVRPGRLRRLRFMASAVRFKVAERHRPDLNASADQLSDVSWAGFEATLDPRRLRRLGRGDERTWEVYITARVGTMHRRRVKFTYDSTRPLEAVSLPAGDAMARAGLMNGKLVLSLRKRWARLRGASVEEGGVLELSGERRANGAGPQLELVRRADRRVLRAPVAAEGGAGGSRFSARVALDDVRAAASPGIEDVWELWTVAGEARERLALEQGATLPAGDSGYELRRGSLGDAVLAGAPPHAVIGSARWGDDATLELSGALPDQTPVEIVLEAADSGQRHIFPAACDGASFTASLPLGAISSLAGSLPLPEATWQLFTRGPDGHEARLTAGDGVAGMLPLGVVDAHKPFSLGANRRGEAVVVVERDLTDDERGRFNQQRLRTSVYAAGQGEPLREAVVYSSFGGRQYSDSPRAIHEELVRRGAPLEHLWVVTDARCRVPDTATVVREGSREYYEALARSRYVVDNDHFPTWFARRDDQICVQTWHGTPLKRLGLDVSEMRQTVRAFQRRWDQQVRNWQYVVSPNRFATPILQRAYEIEGEMLETGYPRVDVLAGAGREEAGRALRARLGLPEDKRVVLYMPTYRDFARDRRGRYRLEPALDIERLRAAVGEDTVVLFRKHHYVIDPVPVTEDGFVRDVSSYPDGTELLLAADVLVTDYSSTIVDFANTGRPMLLFTYDLDDYRDQVRGFYLDFEERAPGPMLRTTGELGEALRGLDDVVSAYADRYESFRAEFCELDDGHAAARVVDRVFGS